MFANNEKLEKGAKVMRQIEEGKFVLLLNRIAQFMSQDETSKPFTEGEESKLETSLEISRSDIKILLDAIIEIFRLSAYYMVKPAIFRQHLENDLQLDSKRCDIFVQVWSTSAKTIVDNLKQKPILSQLNHLSYALSVATSSDGTSKEKSVLAQLQFGLIGNNKREDVNIEFNHRELLEFYRKLEQVQGQLDALR